MKGYIYYVSKTKSTIQDVEAKLKSINYWKDCEHQFDYDVYENILCIAYTNELIELKPKQNQYFFSYSGQINKSFTKVMEDLKQYNLVVARNYLKNLGGAFSFGIAYKPTKTIRIYTHFARVNPVYYYEDDQCIVVGTDPLIVQIIAYNGLGPEIEVEQSISFLMNGYYTDNETIFKGVTAIPENIEMVIENEKVTFNDIDDSTKTMFTKRPTNEDYDELTHSYLNAYDVIPKSNNQHRIGLTGGKDSRLIALGLLEKNIPFKSLTRGFEGHPDVLIAKEIAQKLKIQHTINTPKLNNANKLEIDIAKKILDTMIGTSGNVFGYENIKYNPEYQNRIGLTGVGAECVRGGYGNHSKKNPVNIGEEMVKSFSPLGRYINSNKQLPYENFLSELGKKEKSFKEAQCKHYIFYRVGRWAGGTRNSVLYTADMYSPFFDNQFLKKATQLNINALIGEEVHYNIMKRLNPEIANMAFFASRWSFEQKGPKNPNEYEQWFKRNPIYAKTQLGAYNWRLLNNQDPTLRNAMKEILLNDSKDEIFEVIDYNQVVNILEKPINASLNKLIWGLASIKLYKDYLKGKKKYVSKVIQLDIPSSTIKPIGQQPEMRDLTSIMTPINKALKSSNKKQGKSFQRIKEEKGNLYVQSGTGPLTKPPESDHSILEVQGRKKARFRVCIESVTPIDYDVYIMLFDDKKRISSEVFKVKYTKERMYIDRSIEVSKDTKYLKIAVNFKEKKLNWEIDLKYAYIELI